MKTLALVSCCLVTSINCFGRAKMNNNIILCTLAVSIFLAAWAQRMIIKNQDNMITKISHLEMGLHTKTRFIMMYCDGDSRLLDETDESIRIILECLENKTEDECFPEEI